MQKSKKINWEHINSKLPVKPTPEQRQRRKDLFSSFDPNQNGYLSLAQCDKGIRDVLQLDEIFNCKKAIMRAFQAA